MQGRLKLISRVQNIVDLNENFKDAKDLQNNSLMAG